MSLVLAFLFGFIGHWSEEPIKRWYDGDADAVKLASYSIGGLLILLAFAVISFGLLPRRQWLTAVLSLCGALIGVGSGVVCAHIADGVK